MKWIPSSSTERAYGQSQIDGMKVPSRSAGKGVEEDVLYCILKQPVNQEEVRCRSSNLLHQMPTTVDDILHFDTHAELVLLRST